MTIAPAQPSPLDDLRARARDILELDRRPREELLALSQARLRELSDAVTLAEGPDPSGRPFLRIARVGGRSDDILSFPAVGGGTVDVHPHRLRAPFCALVDVRQYQVVHRRDRTLRVRIVPRTVSGADLPDRMRAAVRRELEEAGAVEPRVEVEVVGEIEREPGYAAKLKLVVSEAHMPE